MRMLAVLQWLLLPLLVLSTGQGTHQLPTHLCLDVDVVYNKPAKEYLEGTRSQNAIQAAKIIVEQANRYFECDALAKDITITLRPRKVLYNGTDAAAKWKVTKHYWTESQRSMTYEQNIHANHVVFLTYDGDWGNLGMAQGDVTRPATCYTYITTKASIVGVQSNSLKTAQVVAHEIAHSLSIPHTNSTCSGIMNTDMAAGPNHWSQCSLDHLRSSYKNYPNNFKCIERDCAGYYRNKKHTGCPTKEEEDKALVSNAYYAPLFIGTAWNIDNVVINPILLPFAEAFGG